MSLETMEVGDKPHVASAKNDLEVEDVDDGDFVRTGNKWTGACHCITAVIGAGVLALPYSVAALGWVGGPLMILMFGAASMYTSLLLSDVYRYPGPETGRRNPTYMDCVRSFLGPTQVGACGFVQYLVLVIIAVGYNVTASISMVTIHRSGCFHSGTSCKPNIWPYAVVFGAIELLFSQIPNLHKLTVVSITAAICSIGYASIGLGMSIGKATEHTHGHGTVEGLPTAEEGQLNKAFYILAAFGQTAFAFIYSFVLIEIQDTLAAKSHKGGPPTERYEMRAASWIGISVTTFFYVSIGCIGYAGFGNDVPENLLTGFGFYNPWWLVDLANLLVVIHLIGTWQVISQPWFQFIEGNAERKFGHAFANAGFDLPLPGLGRVRITWFRLVWRSAYVCATTVLAALFPFFSAIVGIIGSLGFWPMTCHFPTEMHIAQNKLKASSAKAIGLRCFSMVFLIIAIAGIVGNVNSLRISVEGYSAFGNGYTG